MEDECRMLTKLYIKIKCFLFQHRLDDEKKRKVNMIAQIIFGALVVIVGVFAIGKFVYDMNIDILIDDSIDHCNDTINYGKISILFNDITNYNGLMTNDWLELYEIIKKIRI